MKTKFHIDDALLIETLEREYEIDVEDFYFLQRRFRLRIYYQKLPWQQIFHEAL